MKSKEDIEKLLEGLGKAWPEDGSIVNRVMQEIEASSVQITKSQGPLILKSNIFSIMNNKMHSRIAAIILGITAIIAIAVMWTSIGGQNQLAFAQVIENVQQTRSLTLKVKVEGEGDKEIEVRLSVLPEGKFRSEGPWGYAIMDTQAHKAMFVQKQYKSVNITEGFVSPNPEMPAINVYEKFRNVSKEAIERLPDENIEGRSALVFRIEFKGPGKDEKMPMKVWVDPKTELPFRMEESGQDKNGKKIKNLIYDIVFDQPLDPSLFSFDPPEGYAVTIVQAGQNGKARAVNTQKEKELKATGPTIRVCVLGPDDKPMAGAKVHASVWTEEPQTTNRDYMCDAKGQAVVELPKSIHIFRLWARMDGYVPLFAHWEQYDKEPIPEEFTFKLSKGTTIGGFIKNEDGQPIGGARICVSCQTPGGEQKRTLINRWLAEDDRACITDAQGRWTLNNVPEGNDIKVFVNVNHPDYISDLTWGGMQNEQNIFLESLRRQKGTIIMRRGISVTGSVTDPEGKAVAGAVVAWGDDPYSEASNDQEYRHEVYSDVNGVYRLPPLPPGPMTVTVIAKGWAPEMRKITISPENPKVDFQLQPGKTLRIRFVDDSGKPIPDVGVGIEGWRGCKSLYNEKHPMVLDTKIPDMADKNGVYEWTWAPHDEVLYGFGKKGYRLVQPKTFTADGSEQEIHLSK